MTYVKKLGICLASALCASPAFAADSPWQLEAGVGLLYDSHLTFEAADLQQDSGDFAAKVDVNASVTPIDTRKFDLKFGYAFGQTLYSKFNNFDLQTHRGEADARLRIGGARLGLGYDFTHVRLGGGALFNMHSITPSVSGFVADEIYARAFFTYGDKNFHLRDSRDAKTFDYGVSVLKFFQNNRGYVGANLSMEKENARGPAFDFDGFKAGVTARVPIGTEKLDPRLKLGIEYRERDYDSITPSINAVRREDRLRGNVGIEVPINKSFRIETNYRYTDRNSNFPASNYQEHRAVASIVYAID